MNTYELEQLRFNLEDYLQRMGIHTHKSMMSCPICSDKDGFHFLPRSNNQYWKCFSAKHSAYSRNSGDIFELVAQMENITYSEAIKKVNSIYNSHSFEDIPKFKPTHKEEEPKPQKDRTNFYNMALKNQDKAIEYLSIVRGYAHAKKIAKNKQIGYTSEYAYQFENNQATKKTPAVILPTSSYSYAWRSTTKPLKKKSGKVIPYNLECLSDEKVKYIFLVEGEFDALAIVDMALDNPNNEFSAISTNSANNLPRFMNDICKGIQGEKRLIIALDNDPTEQTNQSIREYEKQGLEIAMMYEIPCTIADTKTLYLSQKDGNDALKHDRHAFTQSILNEVERIKTIDIAQYITQCESINAEPKEQARTYVQTYDFDYVGEIDRAFDLCYNQLRYCHQTTTWYVFNGIKLQQDKKESFINTLHQNIKDQCNKEFKYFETLEREDKTEFLKTTKKEHKTVISKVGLLNAIDGMKRRDQIAIELLELDKPNLLNCENVTLDLERLTSHQHRIEDLCAKLASSLFSVELNAQYVEHWNNFLLDIMCNDTSMKAVILAWIIEGYKNYLKLGIKANMPERVIQAIENYQSEANSINVFMHDEDIFERIDIKNYAEKVVKIKESNKDKKRKIF